MRLAESGEMPSRWLERIRKGARRVASGHWEGEGWSADLGSGIVNYGPKAKSRGPLIAYDGIEVPLS